MLAGLSLLTFSVVNGTRRPAGHESKCRQCEDQACLRTTWKEELQLLTRISSSNSIIFSLFSQAPLNPGRAFQVGLIRNSRFITRPPACWSGTGLVPPTRRTLRPPTTVTRAGPARCWLPETQHAAPDERPAGSFQAQTMAAVGGSHALVEELEREKMSCTQAAACSQSCIGRRQAQRVFRALV